MPYYIGDPRRDPALENYPNGSVYAVQGLGFQDLPETQITYSDMGYIPTNSGALAAKLQVKRVSGCFRARGRGGGSRVGFSLGFRI